MLEIKQTVGALVEGNKDAAKVSASIITGDIINKRIATLVKPRLPMIARGYIDTELGQAALSNVIAGVIIHTMPKNPKAVIAAECMIRSASLKLANSFNIQEIVDEILDGITLPGLESTDETE